MLLSIMAWVVQHWSIPAIFRTLFNAGVSGFSLFKHFLMRLLGGGGGELYWNMPEADETSVVKLDGV